MSRPEVHGETDPLLAVIRRVLADNGRLTIDIAAVADDADLYAAGLTSHASVTVMLALEDELEIELPEEAMKRSTFASVTAIAEVARRLRAAQGGPT